MPDSFFTYFGSDRPPVAPDPARWPEEWRTVVFKEYPRSQRVTLPVPRHLPRLGLSDALLRRKTVRNFARSGLSAELLGALLYWSTGLMHKNEKSSARRRPHPSGGSRFPLEIYAAFFRGQGLAAGVYHYNLREHSLECIASAHPQKIQEAIREPAVRSSAAALILLSFVGQRTIRKYGSLGYKLGLLEAGHIGQNLYLVASALGLGISALGAMDEAAVGRELAFRPGQETLIYQLAVGHPAPSQKGGG